MRSNLLLALTLPLMLTACATPVKHNTPSGKPEITINNVTKQEVSDTLANKLTNICPNMVKADTNQIVCEAPVTDALSHAMLYTRYDSEPIARMTFNFLKVNKRGVRVVFNYAGISNPNSAFERRNDWNGSRDTLQVQKMLNDMKTYMEAGKR